MSLAPPQRRSVATSRWVATAVLLTIVGLLVLRFVAEPMRVSSASMAPTYGTGDEVLVAKGPGEVRPERGDVVVFRQPGTEELMFKRVAGVGGDTVAVEDGVLVVNGATVSEAYLDHARVDGTYFGPVTIPAGTVFVLGDNRSDSVDSRDFGAVPSGLVVGRVLIRLWAGRDSR